MSYFKSALVTGPNDIDRTINEVQRYLGVLDNIVIESESDPSSFSDFYDDFRDTRTELETFLAEELTPVLDALSAPVTRPEEARKFKILENKVKRALQAWSSGKLSLQSSDQVYEGAKKQLLDALTFLKKHWNRVERYQKIEKTFEHGPYTIVNDFGYSPDEYEPVLELLDKLTKTLISKRFSNLCYGTIGLTSQQALGKVSSGDQIVGEYNSEHDLVYVAVDQDFNQNTLPTLLHEFGHRLWEEILSDQQRDEYVESFGWISKGELEAAWQLLMDYDFQASKAWKNVDDPILRADFKKRWNLAFGKLKRKYRKYYGFTVADLRHWLVKSVEEDKSHHGMLTSLEDFFFTSKWGTYLNYYKPLARNFSYKFESVSHYGLTNPEEDFCEIFMYHCMGWKINDRLKKRFLRILDRA